MKVKFKEPESRGKSQNRRSGIGAAYESPTILETRTCSFSSVFRVGTGRRGPSVLPEKCGSGRCPSGQNASPSAGLPDTQGRAVVWAELPHGRQPCELSWASGKQQVNSENPS